MPINTVVKTINSILLADIQKYGNIPLANIQEWGIAPPPPLYLAPGGTWNTVDGFNKYSEYVLSGGNLTATLSATVSNIGHKGIRGTGAMTSDINVFEVVFTSDDPTPPNIYGYTAVGISDGTADYTSDAGTITGMVGYEPTSVGWMNNPNSWWRNFVQAGIYPTFLALEVLGVKLDMVAGTVTFYRDGASQGVITAPSLTSGTFYPAISSVGGAGTTTVTANFSGPFLYNYL